MNPSYFFQDLAILMVIAGVVAALFSRLGWPKVIGYILAGVLLNGHTWGGSWLTNESSVQTVGQVGVVFLMFTMGLGFSTSQMKKIGGVVIPVALLDMTVMVWLGYTIGTQLFGWEMLPALFLGAAICDSATSMLAKVIDELHWSDKPFVKYALGSSVCEDILCVGLIALVTGVAQSGSLSLGAAAKSMGGLLVFFLAVISFGFVYVPRLLKSVNRNRDEEALLLTILGCCFLVSYVADRYAFSLALGAFLVGIIGAASDVREKIVRLVDPLKSMFASIFFVSIGLLMDPMLCLAYWKEILILTLVVIVGKFVNCTVATLLAGERVKTAIQNGMALAQIGEFAFMVAMLYITATGDAENPMYNIVVAVSFLTTLANAFLIRVSEPVGTWVETHLPARWVSVIETYRALVAKYAASSGGSPLRRKVRGTVLQLMATGAIIFGVAVALGLLSLRDWSRWSVFFDAHKHFFFCLLVDFFILSAGWPVYGMARTLGGALAELLIGSEGTRWHESLRRVVELVVFAAAMALFVIEAMMLNVNLAPEARWEKLTIIAILVTAGVFGGSRFSRAARRAASRFEEALGAEDRAAKLRTVTLVVPERDLHTLRLDAASPAVGGTVVSLNIRAKTGANVIAVRRGGTTIRNIGPDVEFQVDDELVATGSGAQIAALKDLLGIIA